MTGKKIGLIVLVAVILGLVALAMTSARKQAQLPVAESLDQDETDCPTELAASDLVLTAAQQQDNGEEASPRFSWIPLEIVDGLSVAKSADVYFTWDFAPSVSPDCTYHSGWVLLRSRNPDPVFDDQVYWYRSLGKYNFSRPDDLPSGTWYFRSCLGTYEPVGCRIYSNTITVQIP